MSRFVVVAILLIGFVTSASGQTAPAEQPAAKKPNAPESPPPQWVRVRMDDEHRVRVRRFIIVMVVEPPYVEEERTELVPKPDGTTGERKVPVFVSKRSKPIVSEQVDFVPLEDFKAVTVGGKTVSQKELLARFEKDTLVLLTHEKVDAYYLPLFKDDTLIVALPAKATEPPRAPNYVPSPFGPGYTPGTVTPHVGSPPQYLPPQ